MAFLKLFRNLGEQNRKALIPAFLYRSRELFCNDLVLVWYN